MLLRARVSAGRQFDLALLTAAISQTGVAPPILADFRMISK
jgi:hypothetical protein